MSIPWMGHVGGFCLSLGAFFLLRAFVADAWVYYVVGTVTGHFYAGIIAHHYAMQAIRALPPEGLQEIERQLRPEDSNPD